MPVYTKANTHYCITYHNILNMTHSYGVILIFVLLANAISIEIPFSLGKTTCMALMCSFDVSFY